VLGKIRKETDILAGQFQEKEYMRLTEMSLTLVQLIVRNLFERTADVRWWATDEAFYKCLEAPTEDSVLHAMKRLGIINRFYTVYMNLALTDTKGRIIAISDPEKYRDALGADVTQKKWYQGAMATHSGDDYVVDDIYNDPIHNNEPVAVYATGVRRNGELNGELLGTLAVFFSWGEQSRSIVQDEANLTNQEWKYSRVMLLDANHRVIAASDGMDLLTTYPLKTDGKSKGNYEDESGKIISFAKTIGYEEYDGLGWYGVIVQDSKLKEELNSSKG
jgi:hypothetical protein